MAIGSRTSICASRPTGLRCIHRWGSRCTSRGPWRIGEPDLDEAICHLGPDPWSGSSTRRSLCFHLKRAGRKLQSRALLLLDCAEFPNGSADVCRTHWRTLAIEPEDEAFTAECRRTPFSEHLSRAITSLLNALLCLGFWLVPAVKSSLGCLDRRCHLAGFSSASTPEPAVSKQRANGGSSD